MSQSNKFSFVLPLNIPHSVNKGGTFLGNLEISGTYIDPTDYNIEEMDGVTNKVLFEFIEHKGDAFISNAIANHIEGLIEDPNADGFKVPVQSAEPFDMLDMITSILKPYVPEDSILTKVIIDTEKAA